MCPIGLLRVTSFGRQARKRFWMSIWATMTPGHRWYFSHSNPRRMTTRGGRGKAWSKLIDYMYIYIYIYHLTKFPLCQKKQLLAVEMGAVASARSAFGMLTFTNNTSHSRLLCILFGWRGIVSSSLECTSPIIANQCLKFNIFWASSLEEFF